MASKLRPRVILPRCVSSAGRKPAAVCTGVAKLEQTSRWRVGPSVSTVKAEPDLDPGCVGFFRALWPFCDDWMHAKDELYCFNAVLGLQLHQPALTASARATEPDTRMLPRIDWRELLVSAASP